MKNYIVAGILPLLLLGCNLKVSDSGQESESRQEDTGSVYDTEETDGEKPSPDLSFIDIDEDGFSVEEGDCDDSDSSIHPGAEEVEDGVDNDCDSVIDEDFSDPDLDGDGYTSAVDCDDGDSSVHPGASEGDVDNNGTGLDNDCDGRVDEGTHDYDDDEDGFTENEGDCNDSAPFIHPSAPEILDFRDNDCDGLVDEGTYDYDDDGDGFTESQGDCNDSNASINPSAVEVCDTIDNNCDNIIDTDATDKITWYADFDGDTYGSLSWPIESCTQPANTSEKGDDCNDGDSTINPGVEEVLNDGIDNDCNTDTPDHLLH